MPSGPHEDSAALQVLANILSTQPSGLLYKALVESKKAASASAFAAGEHDPGLLMADANLLKESSVDEVRDFLTSPIAGVGARGVTAEEGNRANQQILKAREMAAANTAQIGVSLSEWAAQGDWRLYFLHRDQIEKVTPEKVQAAATHYLQRNNRTTGVFIPTEKAERVSVPATPDTGGLMANYHGRPPS